MANRRNPALADVTMEDYEELASRRERWEPHWQSKAELVSPFREFLGGDFDRQKDHAGDPLSQGSVHSSVPIEANETWARGFAGYMTGKHYDWFGFSLEEERFLEIPGVRNWLQDYARTVLAWMGRSNFYPQMLQLYGDGGWCGTAPMSVEWSMRHERLVYRAWHPMEIFCELDEHGTVNRVIRDFEMNAINAVERMFPEEAEKGLLSKEIMEAYDKEPYKMFPFLHSVGEREDRMPSKKDSINKPWYSVYMEKDQQSIVRESGFNEDPYIFWRPTVRSREAYGRGPADRAWPEIRKINGLARDATTASQKMVDPAMLVDASLKGIWNTNPGHNMYTSRDPRRKAIPAQENLRYDMAIDRERYAEQQIKLAFQNNTFAMLAQIDIQELKNVRQLAISEIQNERAVLLGPIVGNLEDETLKPMIDRTVGLLDEQGLLPPAPDALIRAAGGSEIKIVYNGPLAQLQREHFEQRAIRNTLRDVMPILQMHESGLDVLKLDDMIRRIARANNLDEDFVRDGIEFETVRQQRTERMQAQTNLEVAESAGRAYKDTKEAPEEESLAAQIMGGAAPGRAA